MESIDVSKSKSYPKRYWKPRHLVGLVSLEKFTQSNSGMLQNNHNANGPIKVYNLTTPRQPN